MKTESYKLPPLLKAWPYGTVAVSSWLKKQGITSHYIKAYEKSGWFRSISHGAFIHADDKVDWKGAVNAFQEQLGLPVHVGGRSALQLHGAAHFLPMGIGYPVFLFGQQRLLPKWFRKYPWNVEIHNVYTNSFPYKERVGLTRQVFDSYALELSTRELAMFEILYLIGAKETYKNAMLLMEGLNDLRPGMVQELLEKCKSIKVKRLFMHLAERFNHPWLSFVNLSNVDFGKGKRVIGEGGQFNSKYKLSVPKLNMDDDKRWT